MILLPKLKSRSTATERNKMQAETRDERFAADALRSIGITVDRVMENGAPSCDYVATDGQARYAIEIKSRTDPKDLWKTVDRGEIYETGREIHRSSHVEAIVDGAMKQLRQTRQRASVDFQVVVFIIQPVFSRDAEFERVMGTLYGTQELPNLGPDLQTHSTLTCLYFRESRFFRHKDLNGAIVIVGSEHWTLCVNNYAANATAFRGSQLCQWFALNRSHFDPDEATRERGYLIADFDMPRADIAAVQLAVRAKYGLDKVVLVNPVEYSAAVAIPRRDLTE